MLDTRDGSGLGKSEDFVGLDRCKEAVCPGFSSFFGKEKDCAELALVFGKEEDRVGLGSVFNPREDRPASEADSLVLLILSCLT